MVLFFIGGISIVNDSEPIVLLLNPLMEDAIKNPGGVSSRLFVKVGASIALQLLDDVNISNPADTQVLQKVIKWSDSNADLSLEIRTAAQNIELDFYDQRRLGALEKAIRYTRSLIASVLKAAYYFSEENHIEKIKEAADKLYIDILDRAPAALIHLEIASGSQVNTYELRTRFAPIIYEIAQAVLEDAKNS